MGVKTKAGNLNMSGGPPAGGKKQKSGSGDRNVDAKDIEEENSANQVTKRESIDVGGPTPKKQKTGQDSSSVKPSQKRERSRKKQKPEVENSSASANESGTIEQEEDSDASGNEPGTIEQEEDSDESSTQLEQRSQMRQYQEKKTPNRTPRKDAFPGWNAGDLLKLIGRIEDTSSNLMSKKANDAMNQIKWNQVAFESHTAEDCRATWVKLQEKSRGTRVLIDEVRKMLVENLHKAALLPKSDVKGSQSKGTSKGGDVDDSDDDDDEDDDEEHGGEGECEKQDEEGEGEEDSEDGEGEEDSEDGEGEEDSEDGEGEEDSEDGEGEEDSEDGEGEEDSEDE